MTKSKTHATKIGPTEFGTFRLSSQCNRDHCEKWWARWIQTTTFQTTLFCTVYEWHLSQEYGYFTFISTIQVPFDTTKHFLWEILLIHGAKKCRVKGWWFWFNLVLFTHSFFVLHLLFYHTTSFFVLHLLFYDESRDWISTVN